MKTFAFIPTKSIQKTYQWLILKYRKQDSTIDFIKVWFLSLVFLSSIFTYLYYVNLSSTSWYFLRQENQKLNKISFEYEVIKTKLLEIKQQDRESIQSTRNKREVVNIKAQIVNIPNNTDLVYNP